MLIVIRSSIHYLAFKAVLGAYELGAEPARQYFAAQLLGMLKPLTDTPSGTYENKPLK